MAIYRSNHLGYKTCVNLNKSSNNAEGVADRLAVEAKDRGSHGTYGRI